KGHPKLGLWYPKDSPFDLVPYSDSDYGCATQDCKSTSGGCQFLGRRLISWKCKKQTIGEGLGTPTEPYPTPSQEAQPSSPTHISLPSIPTVIPIPTVTQSEPTPLRQYTRRARFAQSSALPPIADKPASPVRDDSQGEACPTDSGFIADQDRATIAKSSTLPYDLAPRVTSLAAEEGSMQQTIDELMALCTSLQRQHSELLVQFQAQEVEINRLKERVKILEDNQGEVRLDEGEVAAKRTSEDTEEMATILTTIDAATVLASGAAEVPTGSGSIPNAGAEVPTGSDVVLTASLIFATATVVAKELEEKLAREDQKRAEQIARDAEIARIHTEEELQKLPMERRIELISDLVKYQDNYTKVYKFQSQQRKSWTKKQKRDYSMAVIKNNLGWKEEAERIKRKGINLEQESAKKQKSSEEITEEAKSPEEVTKEKIKEMMQLVLIEEVYVEALQVKHPIIDWEVHTEGQRAYWKITRLGGSSTSYQFFTDLLKHLDREDLNQLWTLVKVTLSSRPPTSDKEIELWVELSRLYEPDEDDQLWTHTQNLMHAPVEWKLYDSCRVHHVAAKDNEIFMLVEKDYPLRKDGAWTEYVSGGVTLLRISSTKHKELDEEEDAAERLSSDIEEVRLDEEEVAAKRTSKDTEEMVTVLITIDAATVLASGSVKVPTGSGSIPTAGAEVPTGSDVVPTASPICATTTVVTPYRKRKGKEVMVESETLKKQKLQEQIDAQVAKDLKEQLAREDQKRAEQIARDAEIARIHAEEEL
nr:ribonuclease H-like domain, reverse transcriptase, RNA-dependent DNA polymerase [Tanacetum cinerariifolium]